MLLLAGIAHTIAQDVQFTVGPAMTERPETRTIFFNPTLKKGYTFVFWEPEFNELDEYLKFNPASKTIKMEVTTGKQKTAIEGYHTLGEKNYILYSTFDKESNNHNVYMQELSKDALLLGAPLIVAKYVDAKVRSNIIVIGGVSPLSVSPVHIVKPISNEFLVFVKEREKKLEVKAFSAEKGELWNESFDLKGDNPYRIREVKVTNGGQVYINGYYYKGEDFLNPFILAFDPATMKSKLHTIQSGENIIDVGYRLTLLRDNTPVIAGLYAQKKDVGYKVFKLNPADLEMQAVLSKPFEAPYQKMVFEGAYRPEFFSVKDIIETKNKIIVIDIEGGAIQSGSHVSQSYTSPVYLNAITLDGKQQWQTIIQKYQVQPLGGDLLGHSIFTKNGKVYVMYNDDIDNLQADPLVKAGHGLIKKNMYVALVEIEETGKAKKLKPVTSVKGQNSFFRPGEVREISPGLRHLMFMKGGKYHFATFSVD